MCVYECVWGDAGVFSLLPLLPSLPSTSFLPSSLRPLSLLFTSFLSLPISLFTLILSLFLPLFHPSTLCPLLILPLFSPSSLLPISLFPPLQPSSSLPGHLPLLSLHISSSSLTYSFSILSILISPTLSPSLSLLPSPPLISPPPPPRPSPSPAVCVSGLKCADASFLSSLPAGSSRPEEENVREAEQRR